MACHMKLIQRGAEADIYRGLWHGRPSIIKVRTPKPYRNAALDLRIRRHRTLHEAQMLHTVKSLGIAAPLVYFVDAVHHTITMEYVKGTTVHTLRPDDLLQSCEPAGRMAGLLHSAGIMHGDLTTSNLLLSSGRLYLIDMGLSRRGTKAEDWAVDLRLVKEVLGSAHAPYMEDAWNAFLSGYSRTMHNSKHILKLVSEIELRGRYARVV